MLTYCSYHMPSLDKLVYPSPESITIEKYAMFSVLLGTLQSIFLINQVLYLHCLPYILLGGSNLIHQWSLFQSLMIVLSACNHKNKEYLNSLEKLDMCISPQTKLSRIVMNTAINMITLHVKGHWWWADKISSFLFIINISLLIYYLQSEDWINTYYMLKGFPKARRPPKVSNEMTRWHEIPRIRTSAVMCPRLMWITP